MKRVCTIIMVFLSSAWVVTATPTINISGTVIKTGGGPLKDVTITLAKEPGVSTVTDSAGKFAIIGPPPESVLKMSSPMVTPLEFTLKGKNVIFSPASGKISGNVDIFIGNGRKTFSTHFTDLEPATQQVTLPPFGPGLTIMRVTINNTTFTCPILRVGNQLFLKNDFTNTTADGNFTLAKKAIGPIVDTLIAKKEGYTDKKTPIDSYILSDITISMDSAVSQDCQVPALPEFSALPNITEFPDPFKMMDGNRMTKKSQWICRREEIKALAEKFMFGEKPPKPDKVEGSYSGGTLTIKCTAGGKSVSFTVKISGNTGTGPYPAMISVVMAVYGVPSGVATITFSEQQLAKSDVNGRDPPSGVFYDLYADLYPDIKKKGALIAWAWGVSRVIDVLEMPDIQAQTKINPKRLGVTGCSYAGKAAFIIGAFDDRIALTVPVESGGGGFVTWRVAEELAPPGKSGQNGCQYASEAYGEANWYGDAFQQFGNAVNKLPVDLHEVGALCAPRGLLGTQALTAWLCPKGGWLAGCATHIVYDALGYPDNMGYLVAATPSHCQKGNTALKEQDVYNAFVKKFLLDDATTNTSPDVALKNTQGYAATDSKYIPWTKPTLEGEYPAATYDKE